MHFSIFLRNSSKTLNHRLTLIRLMGGGPRTLSGGLNKWQWKRMHEKKARVKETRLLDQEKQVYQARVRSQIRSKLESSENPENPEQNQPNYVPLSPQDHTKTLADQFMKEGAEDLWNEADGPLVSPVTKSWKYDKPIKLITELNHPRYLKRTSSFFEARRFHSYLGHSYSGKMCNRFDVVGNSKRGILMDVYNVLNFMRPFSVDTMSTNINKMLSFTRKGSSLVGDGVSVSKYSSKWPRFRSGELNSSDHEDDGFESSGNDAMKNVASSAALGKYDNKIKKRTPLKFLEDEDELSHQVMANHKGVRERSMQDDETEMNEEESIFSTKRFDECGVSSLTVQALTEAGYVQMTSVQKATLSACLEGL